MNDGSVSLGVFDDEGRGVIDRMRQLASEGWTLSDAQQANLNKLAALSAEYNRVAGSRLADNLGQSLGELTTNIFA